MSVRNNASDRVIYETLSNQHRYLVQDSRKNAFLDTNPQNLAGLHCKLHTGYNQTVQVTGQEASVEEAAGKVKAARPELALAAAVRYQKLKAISERQSR